MKHFLEEIAEHFRRDRHELPDDVVEGFMHVLQDVKLQEMPCSEVFAKLDEYVEREARGESAARLMPLLREHLDLCSECCEEYEALLRAVEESPDAAPRAEDA
jgi:hypothetical protein